MNALSKSQELWWSREPKIEIPSGIEQIRSVAGNSVETPTFRIDEEIVSHSSNNDLKRNRRRKAKNYDEAGSCLEQLFRQSATLNLTMRVCGGFGVGIELWTASFTLLLFPVEIEA